MIEEFLKKKNIKVYKKYELDKLSTNDLMKYTTQFYGLMLDNYTNDELFTYINKIFIYWINRKRNDEYDMEIAYDVYLNFLNTTNHYTESYNICKQLMSHNKFENVVYKVLSDLGYVCDGVFDIAEYLKYLKKRISICNDDKKKQELIEEFEYFNN